MNKTAGASATAAGLTPLLVELVKIRASQLNGCSFCLRMHTHDAVGHGETADRLAVLPAWRDSDYFSAQERAALELAESMTLVADGQVPDAVYERVAAVLTPAQISAVGWLTVVINAFNRVAVASRYHVGP